MSVADFPHSAVHVLVTLVDKSYENKGYLVWEWKLGLSKGVYLFSCRECEIVNHWIWKSTKMHFEVLRSFIGWVMNPHGGNKSQNCWFSC